MAGHHMFTTNRTTGSGCVLFCFKTVSVPYTLQGSTHSIILFFWQDKENTDREKREASSTNTCCIHTTTISILLTTWTGRVGKGGGPAVTPHIDGVYCSGIQKEWGAQHEACTHARTHTYIRGIKGVDASGFFGVVAGWMGGHHLCSY